MDKRQLSEKIALTQRQITFQNDLIYSLQNRIKEIMDSKFMNTIEKKSLLNKYLHFVDEIEVTTENLVQTLNYDYEIINGRRTQRTFEEKKIDFRMRDRLSKCYGITSKNR